MTPRMPRGTGTAAIASLALAGAMLPSGCSTLELGNPAQAEVPLPAEAGWRASLVHESDGGIWTVGTCDAWTQHGCPDVFGLDDKGRCTLLASYSGTWTPHATVDDREWLGAFAQVDLDPRVDGHEFYTGGRRGNLYQIVAHADRTFDTAVVVRLPGQEIHTAVGGDLLPSRPGGELLIFTLLGGVYDVRPRGDGWEARSLGDIDARVRQAVQLATPAGEPARIAAASRSGELLLMRLTEDGLQTRAVLSEPMGLGRVARRPGRAGEGEVLYVGRDDGVVLRMEEGPDASWTREVIFAGPAGPRGLAAGRFDADPAVETLAVFGYSRRVQILRRPPGGRWSAETVFEDRDRGHWLAAAELDGRNATDELIGSGYGARIFLLSRPPGHGLDGPALDDGGEGR